MNKRDFLRSLAATSLGLFTGGFRPRPNGRLRWPGTVLRNWLWISKDPLASDDSWKRLFSEARNSGIHAILPEVYDSRNAYYESNHLPVADRWLERILPLARAEGLSVHAWMWIMPCNDEKVRMGHPDWFSVNRAGDPSWEKPAYVDYYRFLCPSNPEVHDFLRRNVAEVSAMDGVDGIHLDYIRFPDVILAPQFQKKYGIVQDKEYPPYDYCYCNRCRDAFREETGTDALQIKEPQTHSAWRQFRYDRISTLVHKVLAPAVREHGKAVTAAVFPNWESVRQQWTSWEIDGVMPMLYHGFYDGGIDWIHERTAWGVKELNRRMPLYSGLFVGHLTQHSIQEAVETSLEAGASGICLFNSRAMTKGHWEGLKYALEQS